MTSTQDDIERSYSVSNDFFKLWLDENLHYTSAVFDAEHTTLEQAQENKVRHLYKYAEIDKTKRVLDIGCGWGSAIDVVSRLGCKEGVGITLSTEQWKYCVDREIPNATFKIQDYHTYEPAQKYDALISIEMIDHLCSPEQAKAGLAVEIYRNYFNKLAEWVEPGSYFGFQAILRNRVPRNREHLLDLQFTADVIFPGGLNPRLEELICAINPRWELITLDMRREDYGKTTGEWHRRLKMHEAHIRETWGDLVYDDYDRYLNACVRQFANHYSGDVQMKLRRIG